MPVPERRENCRSCLDAAVSGKGLINSCPHETHFQTTPVKPRNCWGWRFRLKEMGQQALGNGGRKVGERMGLGSRCDHSPNSACWTRYSALQGSWRDQKDNSVSCPRRPEFSGRQTIAPGTVEQTVGSLEAPGSISSLLSVDLSRAERAHCAAEGSRGTWAELRVKGRGQVLGGRRQALVSGAPCFRHSNLAPSVLWFLPKAIFVWCVLLLSESQTL